MKENSPAFVVDTVSYRNFAEISGACKELTEIGFCFGRPGVGKSLAARRYARWHIVEANLNARNGVPIEPLELITCDVLLYMPPVTVSPPRLLNDLSRLRNRFDEVIARAIAWSKPEQWALEIKNRHAKLIIIDEAHRLKYQVLEQLRDLQEQWKVGIVLIGDPGMERSIARMYHFCDRIAKVDEFKPMEKAEVFEYINLWTQAMKLPSPRDEVKELINWYVRGNPRMLGHLFSMIFRILKINDDLITEMTRDVVETAREMMLHGLNGTLAKSAQ